LKRREVVADESNGKRFDWPDHCEDEAFIKANVGHLGSSRKTSSIAESAHHSMPRPLHENIDS